MRLRFGQCSIKSLILSGHDKHDGVQVTIYRRMVTSRVNSGNAEKYAVKDGSDIYYVE